MKKEAPKFYIHADAIHDKNVGELIGFVNNTDGEIIIGINSGGGSNGTRCFLQKLFTINQDRLTLVALTGIHSAAFELFYNYAGKKALTHGITGMWHMEVVSCRLAANGKPDTEEERAIYRNMIEDNNANEAFAASFMTPEELIKYQKGEDVYFDYNRMKQMFPDAEILE